MHTPAHSLYQDNLELNRAEHLMRRIRLSSYPTFLGIVIGNSCNLRCVHCYQPKAGDNLLRPTAIGWELRREFMSLYPYLTTLRLQGGEVFAIRGFRELLDDVAATVDRPIVSISTNGTLIDEEWAERIVRTPFASVTVSIDGATPETYARLRRGGDLEQVLANIRRIQDWKERLGSDRPNLDSFFVILRSNFHEIPRYFDLMHACGIPEVALQTADTTEENSARIRDEVIVEASEIAELHELLRRILPDERRRFRAIRLNGLRSLFEAQHLDTRFLEEEVQGLYPEGGGEDTSSLCPNPWQLLFVTETGDVHLCFLSTPIGNLYATPLAALWNCPEAMVKRSLMTSGRYLASGCSAPLCSWREGTVARPATTRMRPPKVAPHALPEAGTEIAAVRELLRSKDERIAELESLLRVTNGHPVKRTLRDAMHRFLRRP